jgi:hypothetical protein
MNSSERLVLIFTGNQHQVFLLKETLEENGIASIIQNRFQSGLSSGFMEGSPSAIDLLVSKANFEKAKLIVENFKEL